MMIGSFAARLRRISVTPLEVELHLIVTPVAPDTPGHGETHHLTLLLDHSAAAALYTQMDATFRRR